MERGTRIGPYEITEQAGAGGMGEVYLATEAEGAQPELIQVITPWISLLTERVRSSR